MSESAGSTIPRTDDEGKVNAPDIAAYILERMGPISAMKLQKLVYYAQAWSLVWTVRPLFANRIEAWANGPVVRDLCALHRGEFLVDSMPGEAAALDGKARSIVDAVLTTYGHQSPQALSELTHSEQPWIEARQNAAPGTRSEAEISHRSMRAYYRWVSRKA